MQIELIMVLLSGSGCRWALEAPPGEEEQALGAAAAGFNSACSAKLDNGKTASNIQKRQNLKTSNPLGKKLKKAKKCLQHPVHFSTVQTTGG